MGFSRNLTYRTEGIEVTAPLRYRHFDGVIADLWHARGRPDACGFYASRNPRIIVFFDDVGSAIRITNDEGGIADRPMARIAYVPPGVPSWTAFSTAIGFRHLDLYLSAGVAQGMLAASMGKAGAAAALRGMVERQDPGELLTVAELLATEVVVPRHGELYVLGLVQALLGGLFADPRAAPTDPRFNGAQMRRLRDHALGNLHRRIGTAELAAVVELSESWFNRRFRATTGLSPQGWIARLRAQRSCEMIEQTVLPLHDIALQLGYTDQAHFTRAIRAHIGMTPGALRRDAQETTA
ncbi:AraC family transcriptional regulator [Cereibacter sp. SYSU M97828]|nr:AraC family transcriptional regulator [Cereibacter flavus]